MSQKHLTVSELNDIKTQIDSINAQQQTGEMSLEDALDQARAARKLMVDTLDRTLEEQDPTRVKVWKEVNGLVSTLESEKFEEDRARGAKFGPDAVLDIEARTKIQEVKRLINSMTFNGRKKITREEARYLPDNVEIDDQGRVSDEEYCNARRAMLNDYGKYIDKDHKELVALRQRYHDKTLDNYGDFANDPSQQSKTKRRAALLKKVENGIKEKKYTDLGKAQAIANRLQPSMPESH